MDNGSSKQFENEFHLHGYDELPEETKQKLTEELRAAFHAIRGQLQEISLAIEVYQRNTEHQFNTRSQILELHSDRMDLLQKLIGDHTTACNSSKEELTELLETVRSIRAGMKLTNTVRNIIVWLAGLATAVVGIIQIAKEYIR